MKLTLGEIIRLSEELNGRIIDYNTQKRTKGILSHKLSIKVKYILNNELNKKVIEYVKEFEDARNELVKELGSEIEGTVNSFRVQDDNLEKFNKQLNELMSIEKEVEVPKIDIEELYSIQTEDYYPLLLEKLLAKK